MYAYVRTHIILMLISLKITTLFYLVLFSNFARGCESPIYCKGDLLNQVQESVLFQDSKYFVDMVGKFSEVDIIERFREEQLKMTFKTEINSSANESSDAKMVTMKLSKFIKENFHSPGRELRNLIPKDWREDPSFLSNFKEGTSLYSFASLVHSKWQSLQRKVEFKRICTNCASSMLPLPKPFMVPGGRFRELYYWDSYWIMEGLYVSGMCDSATDMIENFSFLISTYGFIPNGSRTYYLNRSQPPLFCTMVERYMRNCLKDQKKRYSFLKGILPLLDKEYGFWKTQRTVLCNDLSLAIYSANTNLPRPESYREDKGHQRMDIFKNIASGAESGWDFSSRWFDRNNNITSIHTSEIIPVDLNAILLVNEILLEKWHSELLSTVSISIAPPLSIKEKIEHTQARGHYKERAKERSTAINEILYSKEDAKFYDYSLKDGALRKDNFYTSNYSIFFHLIGDLKGILGMHEILSHLPPPFQTLKGIKDHFNITNYQRHRFKTTKNNVHSIQRGGIPCSNVNSGEQWDSPNVWAPIQFYYMRFYLALSDCDDNSDGRYDCDGGSNSNSSNNNSNNNNSSNDSNNSDGSSGGEIISSNGANRKQMQKQKDYYWRQKALEVAERFYKSTSKGYERHGQFFEKYHSTDIGAPGGGGEYWVQEGFGWTNGVLLWMFSTFTTKELESFTSSSSSSTTTTSSKQYFKDNGNGNVYKVLLLAIPIVIIIGIVIRARMDFR